jgi:hypothetical protein
MQKFVVIVIVLAIGMYGLNELYDMTRPQEQRLAEVGELCRSRVVEAGHSAAEADRLCGCMVDRAKTWQASHPDEEYSREVHERLVKNCVAWG